MNLNWFREFLVLASTCNYLEAADRLYIGQSNLSKHIKSMEAELGGPLFDRSSRRVKLTPLGEKLLPFAQQLTDTQLSMQQMLQNHFDAQRGKVTIDSIPAVAQYGVTDVIARFRTTYPDYVIHVSENQPQLSESNLRRGLCDFAFMRRPAGEPTPEGLVEIAFAPEDELVAVLHRSHPLAGCAALRLEQLSGETMITLEEDSLPHELLLSACRRAGFVPRIAFTCHRVDSILDLTSKNLGVGLLMRGHTVRPRDGNFTDEPPFVVCSVTPRIATNVNLYYRRGDALSPAARAFLCCAKREDGQESSCGTKPSGGSGQGPLQDHGAAPPAAFGQSPNVPMD